MAVLGYFDVFPDKTRTELRTAIFDGDDPEDPLAGATFLFTEYFCTDPACHCQRVIIKVFRAVSESACPEEVATISYGWGSNDDEIWSILNAELPNPFLDPFHPQCSYANELLEFWSAMIEHDSAYAARIRRHYDEIRAAFRKQATPRAGRRSRRAEASGSTPRSLTRRERKARRHRLTRARAWLFRAGHRSA